MAPTIPSSLSPHVCILASPDLEELLESTSLPPLPNILQSFSPLPQVTTRTTTLGSVQHPFFTLRFSDLLDVEQACREGEEQRAIRTLDWITSRINSRSARWSQEVDKAADRDAVRTPWWDDLRRCAEGDIAPGKTEAWNHPVAVILAVSTNTPNPLQAITTLHARPSQLPSWVDPNILKYTLILHPQHSALSDEEANALYNAVKKQFGLDTYLLSLNLPRPAPPPVPVPAALPRLPPPPLPDSPQSKPPPPPPSATLPGGMNIIRMHEQDIQSTAKFTREFVVMSLLPWMEKCAIEWSEAFSSTRRLPSRFFSSTRRLFASPSPSPSPTPVGSTALGRSNTLPSANGGAGPPSQLRRLAEFATILGDYKLAVSVWETLAKDGRGGWDILPLLVAPTPSVTGHVANAIASVLPPSPEVPPMAQIQALLYAVRWEAAIPTSDFIGSTLQGERWLTWAAANVEEAPSALILAHAALLSERKGTRRKAALLYVLAASRLEKCGIKPLTMYFLRRALDLYADRPDKELSPSFWQSEGKSSMIPEGLEDIQSGIEHSLGRLLYTTGDLPGAVATFLGLLRGPAAFSTIASSSSEAVYNISNNDKLYLDDFRVAYAYWKSTDPEKAETANLKLPIKLVQVRQSRLRFVGDKDGESKEFWSAREDTWRSYLKAQGKRVDLVTGGKVTADEHFWVDLALENPLDAEIILSDLTLDVQGTSDGFSPDDVEVESVREVILTPKQNITIPVSLKSRKPGGIKITSARYSFLASLPTTESLSCRGRRLHDTPHQRQNRVYAPDTVMQVNVVPSENKLLVNFVEDERLVLLQGENKALRLWLTNAGTKPITEVWLVVGPDDNVWVASEGQPLDSAGALERYESTNTLKPPEPRLLPLRGSNNQTILEAGSSMEVPLVMHSDDVGVHETYWIKHKAESQPCHCSRLAWSHEVQPLFKTSLIANPSPSKGSAYTLQACLTNVSETTEVELLQCTSLSPQWVTRPAAYDLGSLPASQSSKILLFASPSSEASGCQETLNFASRKLGSMIQGNPVEESLPPSIQIVCSHSQTTTSSLSTVATQALLECSRKKYASRTVSRQHSAIPTHLHPFIFPLYHPSSLDLVFFWRSTAENRSGFHAVRGLSVGANHGLLDEAVEKAANSKAKRSMYAETVRENAKILSDAQESEWNMEMAPISVSTLDISPVVHDFSQGLCSVPVKFMLHNLSATHRARYVFKVAGKAFTSSTTLPPPYSGRLTFRGVIGPAQSVVVIAKLWATRPGTYGLNAWTLETEVLGEPVGTADTGVSKRRYLQEAPSIGGDDDACLIISAASAPSNRVS